MLITKLLNSKGVSLVQGLVLSAALAGGALVTTKLLNDQKKSLNDSTTRGHIEQLNDVIFSLLENQANCTRTVQSLLPIGPNWTLGHNVSAIKHADGSDAFKTFDVLDPNNTTYLDGNVAIKSIRVVTVADVFNQTLTNNIRTMDTTGGNRIVIEYERLTQDYLFNKRQRVGFGAKVINKAISVVFQEPTPGNFTCFAVKNGNVDLVEEMCNSGQVDSLGNVYSLFTWDATSNSCRPKNNICTGGKLFVGIDSKGAAICEELKQQMPMQNLINGATDPDCLNSANVRFEIYFDSTAGFGHNRVRIRCD